jgi:hypothetical protein
VVLRDLGGSRSTILRHWPHVRCCRSGDRPGGGRAGDHRGSLHQAWARPVCRGAGLARYLLAGRRLCRHGRGWSATALAWHGTSSLAGGSADAAWSCSTRFPTPMFSEHGTHLGSPMKEPSGQAAGDRSRGTDLLFLSGPGRPRLRRQGAVMVSVSGPVSPGSGAGGGGLRSPTPLEGPPLISPVGYCRASGPPRSFSQARFSAHTHVTDHAAPPGVVGPGTSRRIRSGSTLGRTRPRLDFITSGVKSAAGPPRLRPHL